MSRPIAVLCLSAAGLLGPATTAAAQERPDGFVLLASGRTGQPAADAIGEFRTLPAHELPALRGVRDAAAEPRWITAHGTERGILRAEAGDAFAAAGLVSTPHGLGALVGRLLPGRADRVQLQPMAAVTTATGSETFTLFARAVLPDGETVVLPPRTGTEVRLPAGVYEAWAQTADGFLWQRLQLASGERAVLDDRGPVQRLRCAAGTALFPAGFVDVPLLSDGGEVALRGGALAAPLLAERRGLRWPPMVPPGPPRTEPLPWPAEPDAERIPVPCPAAAGLGAACRLATLAPAGDGFAARCIAARRGSGDGAEFDSLAAPPDGSWLLLVAPGRAPRALPWSERTRLAQGLPGGAEPTAPLVVRLRDEQGLPAVDVAVDYTPDGMPPARTTAHSDARGVVRFGPVLAPGVLRCVDPRVANAEFPVAATPATPLELTVAAGLEIAGRVLWSDGSPAGGIVISLRDVRALLHPATRTVVTGPDGTFRFGGLPERRDFVLFATALRDGHTWIARRERAAPADGAVELSLHDEDPDLASPQRR